MKFIKPILTVLLFSFLIVSCSKKNKLGKMIPKNASLVVDINSKSLFSKLTLDEIKKTYWFQQIMSDSSHAGKGKIFLEDPTKTGIDLKSNIVFFVVKNNADGQFVMEGAVKNNKDFTAFLKTMHPEATVGTDGELSFMKSDDAVIGWNDDNFVFVSAAPDSPMPGNFNEDSVTTDSAINVAPIKLVSPDTLLAVCKNIFSLKGDNSLSGNERFSDLLDENGDIHFWLNTNELYKSSMQGLPGPMGMVKLDKILEDNVSTATVSFDDGKITATSKLYAGKELSDILKSSSGNINTDMIKRNASSNPAVVFAMHFNPENLLGIIRLTGLDGFINMFLSQQGLSVDEIGKATKGDIFFSISDVKMGSDTIIRGDKMRKDSGNLHLRPDATFLFSVAINDKNAFNKLVKFGESMGNDSTPKKTFTKSDDRYYTISNTQDAANRYYSGIQTNPPFLDRISGHPLGAYVDLQTILRSLQPKATADSTEKILYDKNVAVWNNVFVTGGEYKDGGLVYNYEVNLLDKTTNSLKQLNALVDQMARITRENKKKNWQSLQDSSKLIAPKSDTVK